MPYDPKALTESDRNWALNMMWVGLVSSIIMLAAHLLDFGQQVESIFGGFTAGTLIGMAFVGRQDEFYNQLAAVGARWALSVAGIWLFLSIIPFTREAVTGHLVGLYTIAAAFHVGFAFARWRS